MIPKAFELRMRQFLGNDADAFFEELSRPDSVHALRVNTAKMSVKAFQEQFSEPLEPIPYAEDGFYVASGKLGNTPYHHAGAFYLQDPAAMGTMHLPAVQAGWRVLDVCAAPGGKSGQASAYVGDGGFVIANEYVASRARVLAGNLERLGCRNTAVTNVEASVLGTWFPAFFHLVVVDAPCSGEGMFRKSEEAVAEWSEENVRRCAERQRDILSHAASCVMPGGYLLYSTCTYAPEENEQTVAAFLADFPEFAPVPAQEAVVACTAPGQMQDGCAADMTLARRFYPHVCRGEGQFAVLLRREGRAQTCAPSFRETAQPLTRQEQRAVDAFLNGYLTEMPAGRFVTYRSTVLWLPEGMPIPPFGVLTAGVPVGTVTKDRLEPAHHLFSAFGQCFRNRLDLSASSPDVAKYLHGESIPAPGIGEGWGVLTVDGCPLGGIKVVGGTAKNHYPKGLRIPS